MQIPNQLVNDRLSLDLLTVEQLCKFESLQADRLAGLVNRSSVGILNSNSLI